MAAHRDVYPCLIPYPLAGAGETAAGHRPSTNPEEGDEIYLLNRRCRWCTARAAGDMHDSFEPQPTNSAKTPPIKAALVCDKGVDAISVAVQMATALGSIDTILWVMK